LARILLPEEVSFPGPYDLFPVRRKPGDKVVVGNGISIRVVGVTGNRVRTVLDAPDEIRIPRADLVG